MLILPVLCYVYTVLPCSVFVLLGNIMSFYTKYWLGQKYSPFWQKYCPLLMLLAGRRQNVRAAVLNLLPRQPLQRVVDNANLQKKRTSSTQIQYHNVPNDCVIRTLSRQTFVQLGSQTCIKPLGWSLL